MDLAGQFGNVDEGGVQHLGELLLQRKVRSGLGNFPLMHGSVDPTWREAEADLQLSEDVEDLGRLEVAGLQRVPVLQNTQDLRHHWRLFSAEETIAGHLSEPRENPSERSPGDAVLPDGLIIQELSTN